MPAAGLLPLACAVGFWVIGDVLTDGDWALHAAMTTTRRGRTPEEAEVSRTPA
jgi:hypothetical protein